MGQHIRLLQKRNRSMIGFGIFALAFAMVGSILLLTGHAAVSGSVDINGDGIVNTLDLSLLLSHWGQSGALPEDINGDGAVNVLDLSVLLSHFGQSVGPSDSTAAAQIELAILNNIKQNGFDNDPAVNSGSGGLWINWRYGSSPLQVNFNGTAQPDGSSVSPPRHDPLTDIRYIHNLWLYKAAHPSDTQFDSEITRYTQVIKTEFANAHDAQRGWEYDEEFTDLYRLSNDSFYQQQMQNLAAAYIRSIDPAVGIYYKTDTNHPNGYYRPEDALEVGLALIQAGTQFNNPSWTQAGQVDVNFVYSHAYIAQYHTFGNIMDDVNTVSGTVNPNEIFYYDNTGSYPVYGNQVNVAGLGQIVLSLLHTYEITHTQDYLNKVTDLLAPLTAASNSLQLWDPANLGYYESLNFTGTTSQNPGTFTINNGKKEAGRQATMLWAYHLANSYTNNSFAAMESAMRQVALYKAYYAPGRGVIYEMRPDWSLVTINGTPEDWVTTEAMGCELEALFAAVP